MDLQQEQTKHEAQKPTYEELIAIIRAQGETIMRQAQMIQKLEEIIRLQAEEIKLLKKSSTAQALNGGRVIHLAFQEPKVDLAAQAKPVDLQKLR